MKRCKHTKRLEPIWDSGHWHVIAERCGACGAVGVASLGPTNDEPAEVQVEMRAAELSASWTDDPGMTDDEYEGWQSYRQDQYAKDDDPHRAGWLSREARYAGTERDLGSWSWDPSRPIAEQLAETERVDASADVLGADGAIEAHHDGKRHAASYEFASEDMARLAEAMRDDGHDAEVIREYTRLVEVDLESEETAGVAQVIPQEELDVLDADTERAIQAMETSASLTIKPAPTPRCICDAEAPSPAVALSHGWTLDGGVWRCNHWRSDVGDEPASEVVP